MIMISSGEVVNSESTKCNTDIVPTTENPFFCHIISVPLLRFKLHQFRTVFCHCNCSENKTINLCVHLLWYQIICLFFICFVVGITKLKQIVAPKIHKKPTKKPTVSSFVICTQKSAAFHCIYIYMYQWKCPFVSVGFVIVDN